MYFHTHSHTHSHTLSHTLPHTLSHTLPYSLPHSLTTQTATLEQERLKSGDLLLIEEGKLPPKVCVCWGDAGVCVCVWEGGGG